MRQSPAHESQLPQAHPRNGGRDGDLIAWSLRTGETLSLAQAEIAERTIRSVAKRLKWLVSPTESPWQALSGWKSILPRPGRTFYEENSLGYNQSQFLKNFSKCLIASQQISDHWIGGDVLIDLGSGAGPMSFAALAQLPTRHSILVDECRAQLALSEHIADALESKDAVSAIRAKICGNDIIPQASIAASYWLSENPDDHSVLDSVLSCRNFFIVDVDDTISALEERLRGRATYKYDHMRFKVTGDLSTVIEGGGGEFSYIYGTGHKDQ